MLNLELTRSWSEVYKVIESWAYKHLSGPWNPSAWNVHGFLRLGALERWGASESDLKQARDALQAIVERSGGVEYGNLVIVIVDNPSKPLSKALRNDLNISFDLTQEDGVQVRAQQMDLSFGGKFSVIVVLWKGSQLQGVLGHYGTVNAAFALPFSQFTTDFFSELSTACNLKLDGSRLVLYAPDHTGKLKPVNFFDSLGFWGFVRDTIQNCKGDHDLADMQAIVEAMIVLEMRFYHTLRQRIYREVEKEIEQDILNSRRT